MKMRRHSIAAGFLVLTLMLVLGADACPGAWAMAGDEDNGPEVPTARVLGVAGQVTVANEGGEARPLPVGHELDLGQTLTTGPDGRAALELMNVGLERAARGIHVSVGPKGGIERLVPAECSEYGPPTVLRLNGGLCRIDADNVGEGAPILVLIGSLTIDVRGADVLFNYEPAKAKMTCLLDKGELTVPIGERRIRVLERKKRTFFGDQPRGSSGFEKQEWDDLAGRMLVPGVWWTDPAKVGAKEFVHVRVVTNHGEIVLELNAVKAPISTANFLFYVDKGFYNGTIFHRVVPNFMIQAGGYDVNYRRKATADTIANEWQNGLKNERGAIAMARKGGQPDSANSQFFINVKDNTGLDRPQRDGAGYAVFGRVISGMDVVDAIAAVETGASRLNPNERSEPVETVLIERMERVERLDNEETPGS